MSPDWTGASDRGPNGTEVVTAQQLSDSKAPFTFTLNSGALLDASEVTDPGSFPQYGEFLNGVLDDGETVVYVEAPFDLKAWLDLNEIDVGDTVRIEACLKNPDSGRWQVSAERVAER